MAQESLKRDDRDDLRTDHANAYVMSHMRSRAVLCRQFVTPHGYDGSLHRHVGLEIIFCQAGHGTLTVGNQSVPYHPGHLIYFDCRIPHKVSVEGEYRRWGLCFWPESLDAHAPSDELNRLIQRVRPRADEIRLFHVPQSDWSRLERHFEDLSEEVESQRSDFALMFQLHIMELHILLKRFQHKVVSLERKGEARTLKERVADVLSYIEANLASPITSKEIAGAFHYSASHLNRLMKQATGCSFSDYVKARRLERAKRLLVHSDLKVTGVAEAVGIPNVAYFCRKFREETGLTPGEFRSRESVQAELGPKDVGALRRSM